jgi:small subunit ribosomal protein S19e
LGIYDVPAAELIKEVAKDLKQRVKAPEWTRFVKTGSHVERAPTNPDWFFVRNASILYRIFREGPLGTGSLRTYYGGRKNRGKAPERKRKAGGKVIRVCLQTLENDGLIKKDKKGRAITGKGMKYLNAKAKEVKVLLEEAKKIKHEVKQVREEDSSAKEAREALRQQQVHEKAREKKAEHREDKPQKKEEKNE